MYEVAVIGAGVAGASFAYKTSKYAKTLLIESKNYNVSIPERVNIFAQHNKPYVDDIFWNDKEAFPKDFLQLNYKSEKSDGLISGKEFGPPQIGRVTHTDIFLQKLINKAVDQGATTKFNEKISKVIRHKDSIELINNKGESYETKLLVLATGSHRFELQKSLGFEAPDSFVGIYLISNASEELLNQNFNFQYMFHLNPNISKVGPFFFNVGKGRIFTGFMGEKESPLELKNKLERILNNYQKIQQYIKGINWNFDNVVTGEISKHPINRMTSDKVIVLGEAAGLVTSFFYEGMLCGLVSADSASKIIKPLIENNSNFNSGELVKYDQEIKELLLNGYFRNGNACEYLFYDNQSSLRSIWNAYTEMLVKDKTARKYVYEVIMLQDLKKYSTDNDRWVGERLFANLPFISKATLWPKFLKAMSF